MKLHPYHRPVLPVAMAAVTLLSVVSVSLLTAGCGGGNNATSNSGTTRKAGSVSMTIKWPQRNGTRKIPLAANSLTVTVTGATSTLTKTVARPTNGATTSTVSFSGLPLGSYTLTGAAFASTDGSGIVLAQAATTVAFTLNNTSKAATLDLASAITRLAVTPDPLSLATEGAKTTGTLSASGFDASGNMIPLGTLTFSSADPTIATVNASTGFVTAKALGTTTITVTDSESGIAGTVKVIVEKIASPLWSQTLDGPIHSSATVAPNGNIYIGGSSGEVYGFAPNGTPLPNFPVDLSGLPGDEISAPVIDGAGNIYLTSDFGNVYVVDMSGNILLAQAIDGAYAVATGTSASDVTASVAVGSDGTIYVPTATGQIAVIQTPLGTPNITAITVSATPTVVNTPVIDAATGNIYVTSSTLIGQSALLHGFKSDGTSLFNAVTLDGGVVTGVALGTNGDVYAATGLTTGNSVKVYAAKATTGAILSGWPVTLPNATLVSGAVRLGADNSVYVGTWGGISTATGSVGGQVFALNPTSGAVKSGWPFQIPYSSGFLFSDVDSAPAIGPDGKIYVGSENGSVYAIGTDGQEAWEASLLSDIHSTPAVAPDGTTYIGAFNGTLTALK